MNMRRAGNRWLGWGAGLGMMITAVLLLILYRTQHAARVLRMPDGTEIFYQGDSTVTPVMGYPTPREMNIDGDVFVRATSSTEPLVLRSRLLVVTVAGESTLRLTARSKEAGEEVEVLTGHAQAAKAYASPYPEPDTLAGSEMSMVNKDIDLMEKEHFDPAELRHWSDALVAAARAKRN